jgi:hypothetical protein
MPPITRSDATALEHILGVLLAQPPTSADGTIPPFCACLITAGVLNATDFISVEPTVYGSILFSTTTGGDEDQHLNAIQIKKLDSLFLWFHSVSPAPVTRWFDLDADGFQAWRIRAPTPAITSPSPSTSSVTTTASSSVIHDFRKGIKRSVSDYKPFKEDRLWHAWHRHILTTARAQNVENVLDLTYKPSTPDEVALLAEQQKFVFSVFEQTIFTSDGIVFVRIHSSTGDATAVFRAMVERYGRSTAAQLSASEIEGELSTFRLDTTWKKTNLAFLNAWTTKVLDLDLVLEQPTSESQKRIWFTRSIAPKTLLAMSISQFEASNKLTALAMGSSYSIPPFSTLFEHVKDDAIRLDSTERLATAASRQAHTATTSTPPDAGTPTPPPPPPGGNRFTGRDGRQYHHLIPPEQWKTMTHLERTAELDRRRAAEEPPLRYRLLSPILLLLPSFLPSSLHP